MAQKIQGRKLLGRNGELNFIHAGSEVGLGAGENLPYYHLGNPLKDLIKKRLNPGQGPKKSGHLLDEYSCFRSF